MSETPLDRPGRAAGRRALPWIAAAAAAVSVALSAAALVPIARRELLEIGRKSRPDGALDLLSAVARFEPGAAKIAFPLRLALPLSREQRAKGFNECMVPDPGYGPYAAPRSISMGRLFVPQEGGVTDDGGYDVILHFHGHDAVRKTLVQVARGVVLAGVDLGTGSGPYERAFALRPTFLALRESIERGLKSQSGNERAHIRRLALSSWSAGYGAINSILRTGDDGIDAVILLDSLHGSFQENAPHDGTPASVSLAYIAPLASFARRAAAGERLMYLSHTEVDPVTYPSTSLTSAALLSSLGIGPEPVARIAEPFSLRARADQAGFHYRSTRGGDESAHCEQTRHIAEAVRDVLEPAWNTPPMRLGVPPVDAPRSPVIMREPRGAPTADDDSP